MYFLLVVTFLFVFAPSSSKAQYSKDSIYSYKYSIRYEGASVEINQNYRYIMEHLVETLKKDTMILIHIRGHVCCGPGIKISTRRARNVYRFLRRNGIPERRITYKGYSNEVPLAFPEKTKEDAARNRRVDFILTRRRSI